MIVPTLKQGVVALLSAAGITGGYTLKENFWHTSPQTCIASKIDGQSGNIQYFNTCAKPITAMVCEDRHLSYGWFVQARGSMSCFRREFMGGATYISAGQRDDAPTGIAITECSINSTPRWTATSFECVLNNF